jgi:protein dithiol oxidoreductase (disulfide-forming)
MKAFWAGCLALMCVFTASVSSAVEKYEVGKDYFMVSPQAVEGNKILVEEFFWYGCPHCNSLEPHVNAYLKKAPANVNFVRVAVPGPSWKVQAQAFYAFEQLGMTDKVHNAFFEAWHAKGRDLKDEASVTAFAVEHGADKDKFKKAYHSFGVNTQLERARQRFVGYRLDGVPALVVDGKYMVQPGRVGDANALKVVDFLVQKAAAERKKSASR